LVDELGYKHTHIWVKIQAKLDIASGLDNRLALTSAPTRPATLENLHGAYTAPESKKPSHEGWAKCLILLVPTAGFELAT
jgi:hypothetical protein